MNECQWQMGLSKISLYDTGHRKKTWNNIENMRFLFAVNRLYVSSMKPRVKILSSDRLPRDNHKTKKLLDS